MQYARDLIDLMAAYPGRSFRMGDLVNYCGGGRATTKEKRGSVREGIRRVLAELHATGSVIITRESPRAWPRYTWRG
jgi:hypothetical protein